MSSGKRRMSESTQHELNKMIHGCCPAASEYEQKFIEAKYSH